MAKRKSTPIGRRARSVSTTVAESATKKRKLPPATSVEVLQGNVERERLRLFQARAVLECARCALEYQDAVELSATDVSMVVDIARELIEGVIRELDSQRLTATFYIQHCPGTQMDGDGDRVPCESQWCGKY
jgi:Excalibur calcium-binding domain